MNNRIKKLFSEKKRNILSVYFTAGFPGLDDTITIMEELQSCGADMIEIGIPFSDPLADGPVIQRSNGLALNNGMSLKLLFEQLKNIRQSVSIPLLLMGYLNPLLQYGIENFCMKAKQIGIDGVIIPDLPFTEFLKDYKRLFDASNLLNILMITPQTSADRIGMIDEGTNGFIYMVSSAGTTGTNAGVNAEKEEYFQRIARMKLAHPTMIGFGIATHDDFVKATKYANGAIIGSAFITALEQAGDLKEKIRRFINGLKNGEDSTAS